MSGMRAQGRRGGWASRSPVLIAGLMIVAFGLGAAGEYWLSRRGGSGRAMSPAPQASDDQELWYTCGMHPNVLQRGPGDCPICQMKLTPLRTEQDSGAGGGEDGPQERKILYWRAPMDPNYVSDKPGKSPMGMDLVPVYADQAASVSAHTIRIDPVTIQNMGIRTTTVKRGSLVKTIRTIGRVDYDEQLVTFINTKFDGWIEKLYVDETGQYVEKGQPLFEVYSPQLYSAQEEYLAAIRNLPRMKESTFPPAVEEARRLVEAARIKLKYMDVSDEQIDQLADAKQPKKSLTIHSPSRGIVTDKMALEGMYVKPGMRLYTIADLARVWVYLDIYEYQLPWIRAGQKATVTLSYIPGREFVGRVVYIYPYLDKQTRVIKVRLEFENPTSELMPDMYANVTLEAKLDRDALLIPREAYIDSGTRKLVFVDRGGGKFMPRDIQVGVEAEDGMVEVLYGLDQGEVVVTSGQFMLDAESKLKEAVAKMMEADRAMTTRRTSESPGEVNPGQDPGPPAATRPSSHGPVPQEAAFACPMEEHPDETDPSRRGPYFSKAPGRCPRCGMSLKPLEDLDWVQARLAAQDGDLAYTCPDHQHVFSRRSGRCPRCEKKLMPFKVMYACPDPDHAGVISTARGNCPHCGRGLAAFRGIWLDQTMARQNLPPRPELAKEAPFQCPLHPLVHSPRKGKCTICGAPLRPTQVAAAEPQREPIPADAKYACPMEECWYFSAEAHECQVCGMEVKPLDQVPWAREALAAQVARPHLEEYVCPMHPEKVRAAEPGTCSICGMQLVLEKVLRRPRAAPEYVAVQMDYIMEHYLELQKLLASDRSKGIALHALGLASASEEMIKHLRGVGMKVPLGVLDAVEQLRAAALKITGTSLTADRVTFVELSAAVRTLVEHARPDRRRWPKLYVYRCPLSKGEWLQATEKKANPYYGFKMLNCGELKGIE